LSPTLICSKPGANSYEVEGPSGPDGNQKRKRETKGNGAFGTVI
jgi:hypothetical protein